jgi:enoyl-CoA hydratase/carnithine racemase
MTTTPSSSGKLLITKDGPVTTVTLNRPEVHNALDRELSKELNLAMKEIDIDRQCRVVIFKGAGETFCAGDDVKGFATFEPEDGPWEIRMYQQTANLIDNLVPVTIAAVDGVCTGGGLELTLVCDFVVATDRSRWGMPEINWDITPGWGGTGRLSKSVGRRKTKEWNLIDALFDAHTAERYDLANRVVTPERLDAEVAELVDAILAKDAKTVTTTKYFIDKAADLDMWSSMFFEGAPQRGTDQSGILAFADPALRAKRHRSRDFWQDREPVD